MTPATSHQPPITNIQHGPAMPAGGDGRVDPLAAGRRNEARERLSGVPVAGDGAGDGSSAPSPGRRPDAPAVGLVLTRERDQRIVIGGNIIVTVVDIRGDKVRLGIVAPRSVRVDREEVKLAAEAGSSVSSGAVRRALARRRLPLPLARPGEF